MRIKLDEGLSYQLKTVLGELGHDVDTVTDEDLRSEPDEVIARAASQNNRMLFTLDRGLGDIRQYAPGTHPGIVVFRLRTTGPGAMSAYVETFVRQHNLDDWSGCVVIAYPGRVRVMRQND